jgi:CBS domain
MDPDTSARKALEAMIARGISQLPVVRGDRVLGVFSYRSFAKRLCKMLPPPPDAMMLPIMEYIEQPQFSSVETDVADTIPALDQDDSVLIGDRAGLKGIVTTIDVLKFFYSLASPYVLIAEIEIAIRALIRRSTDSLGLAECVARVNVNGKKMSATTLEKMTFNNYITIVSDAGNWPLFHRAFGGPPEYIRARLDSLRNLRNEILHFKRPLTNVDYEHLRIEREWLRSRADLLDATSGAGSQ